MQMLINWSSLLINQTKTFKDFNITIFWFYFCYSRSFPLVHHYPHVDLFGKDDFSLFYIRTYANVILLLELYRIIGTQMSNTAV